MVTKIEFEKIKKLLDEKETLIKDEDKIISRGYAQSFNFADGIGEPKILSLMTTKLICDTFSKKYIPERLLEIDSKLESMGYKK